MASVLIIDDDPPIRALLRTLVRRAGHQTHEARDSREAAESLRRGDFDVLLLDLMMPTISGFDLLDLLRCEHPEKLRRVIVVTAAADRDLHRTDLQGIFAVLRKPFDLDELLATITACLSSQP